MKFMHTEKAISEEIRIMIWYFEWEHFKSVQLAYQNTYLLHIILVLHHLYLACSYQDEDDNKDSDDREIAELHKKMAETVKRELR